MAKLALFDLDDTLVDRTAAFHIWAQEFVVDHSLDEGSLSFLLNSGERHSGPMGGFFETIRRALGLTDPVERLWAQYRRRMPELVSCRPRDMAALAQLREAGWRVGIVTNGMTDSQLGKLRQTGLDELVDGWCISEEAGLRKPDPAIFQLAAARCAAERPSIGWMVGDNLQHDVVGARAAGLGAIWIRPNGILAPEVVSITPDHIVGTVAEAATVILTASQTEPQ
ncbi:HAD family hydrolase [Micromonospora parva]|uniref:HAD family hydrolase n=1 Tax=Micromonospora parva TaxID=1464048 RepID=UPI003406C15D